MLLHQAWAQRQDAPNFPAVLAFLLANKHFVSTLAVCAVGRRQQTVSNQRRDTLFSDLFSILSYIEVSDNVDVLADLSI